MIPPEPGGFAAVIFDLFGTLVPEMSRDGFFAHVEEMGRILGADPDAFRAGWEATVLARQTGGFADMSSNLRAICASMGVEVDPSALVRALDLRAAMYDGWFHPRPGAMETLREVKARAYPVALVSMCAPDTPDLWRASAMAPYVDVTVFSSEAGLRKPDPPIYLLACERLGVVAEACLYCGDGAYGELTGAEAVGMTAYLIRDTDVDHEALLRPEGEDWHGATVQDLRELLPLLPGPS